MQRIIYAYKLELQPVSEKRPFELDSFEDDFIEVVKDLCSKDANDRKHDFRQDKKILYLDLFEYNDEYRIINMKFISAKYNARRRVVDTNTLYDKGILKDIGDGDEERNHVCIKFLDNNTALCLYEANYYGIGFGKIIYYLQYLIKKFHRSKKDGCYYNLNYEHIVSSDFLDALSQITKVKAVTLTVDQEDISVSDFKALSGRTDISPNVDIMLKPVASGIGIKKDTVKEFFKIYNNQKKSVKRVTVQGDGSMKETLSFDTDQMKKKIIVNIEETKDTGEVSTRSMFDTLFIECMNLE